MAGKLISGDPTPRELEERIAELPEPPAGEVEQLRRDFELSQQAAAPAGAEGPPLLQEARSKVDVRYPGPPTSDRPLVGPALVFAKRVFRLLGQPFINEALRKQVEFNQAILAALGQIHESLQQHVRNQALWRAELDARLERLERERQEATPPPAEEPASGGSKRTRRR